MHQHPRRRTENRVLSALPREDYERLSSHLEEVKLTLGKVLYGAGEQIEHVYFPLGSTASLISQTPDGESVEVGVVGFEGMVGISRILGVDHSPHHTIVQIPDGALRMKAGVLVAEFKRGGALHDLLLRHTQALLLQISQIAACNRLHNLSERLARWLLMCHDRCACDDLPLTHEFLSIMLGVRRSGVTEAAIVLQAEGLIRYTRGNITILDRPSLEDFTCSCYAVVKEEFDRLPGQEQL